MFLFLLHCAWYCVERVYTLLSYVSFFKWSIISIINKTTRVFFHLRVSRTDFVRHFGEPPFTYSRPVLSSTGNSKGGTRPGRGADESPDRVSSRGDLSPGELLSTRTVGQGKRFCVFVSGYLHGARPRNEGQNWERVPGIPQTNDGIRQKKDHVFRAIL